MQFSQFAATGVRLAGAVLLVSALGKAIAPQVFAEHLSKLASLPRSFLKAIAVLAVSGETALAVPLILIAGPLELVAATLALLVVFTLVTLTAWRMGKIDECGCYGPLLRLSPPISAGFNFVPMALLATALIKYPGTQHGGTLTALVWAVTGGLATALLAGAVLLLPRIIVPIASGRVWPARWLPQVKMPLNGEHLVVFLQPGCRACQAWAKALGQLTSVGRFWPVTVIAPGKAADAAALGKSARSPVVYCGVARFWILAHEVPMAALVRDGVVCEVWRNSMPEVWVQRLRQTKSESSSSNWSATPVRSNNLDPVN
jgi:hypothetical protein